MSLRLKFTLIVVGLVFTILSTAGFLLIAVRSAQIREELMRENQSVAAVLAQEFAGNFADYFFYQYDTYREYVSQKLVEFSDVRHFAMYNTEGEVLFDSNRLRDPPGASPVLPTKSTDPEVQSAINSQRRDVAIVLRNNEQVIRVFIPYIDKFNIYRNMFEFHFSMRKIREAVRETILITVGLLAVFTLVSLIIGPLLIQYVIRPIETLKQAANAVSSGNLDYAIDIRSDDELGALAQAFSQMTKDLKVSQQKLSQQNELLEAEVKKQTQVLRDQVMEMEKFQKITVDRELKMIEMKKELDALRTGQS